MKTPSSGHTSRFVRKVVRGANRVRRCVFRYVERLHLGQLIIAAGTMLALGLVGTRHFGEDYDQRRYLLQSCLDSVEGERWPSEVHPDSFLARLERASAAIEADSLTDEEAQSDVLAAVATGLALGARLDLLETMRSDCRERYPHVATLRLAEVLSLLLVASVLPLLWIWFGARRQE